MKLSSRRPIARRDFIRLLGGAAVSVPFLELFEHELKAATAPNLSKFVVFLYTPDGVNQAAFWPTGTETNFQLSPILSPFEPFKDKMLIMGPQLSGSTPITGTGLAYRQAPPQHQAPITLSARVGDGCAGQFCSPAGYGLSYLDQAAAVNRIDGPSIDQVIARAVQADSPFSSLNFGLHPIGGDTPSDIHFAEDGTSLRRMASADEAWNRVFGPGSAVAANQGVADHAARELRKQSAVSDFLHARFGTVRNELSTYDRQIVDRHLATLRGFEERKARFLTSQANQQMLCAPPARATVPTDDDAVRTGADTERLSPFFMDIIATAFSCNLTRVASLSFGYPGGGDAGGLRMPWLGFTDPLHGVSHHSGDPVAEDKYRQMNTWIASQVAGLMHRLGAIPLGNGTLLDQTTIYWFNRHGDGNAHTNWGLPNVLLGGTGGTFKMGRFLQLPSTNPTKVLISIANAMGVDVGTFGKDPFRDSAPLGVLTG